MALLLVPQPYDFDLSLDRFTFWGVDRATVWSEGALYRVVDGREVRIAPTDGGVQVEPFDAAIEPVVRKLLGLELDLPPFYAFAQGDPVLAEAVRRFSGFRPPLAPDPFEALVSSITAQQVSLHAAFAVRSRFIERFGAPPGARPRRGPGEGVRGRRAAPVRGADQWRGSGGTGRFPQLQPPANREVPATGANVLAFPTRERIGQAGEEELTALGFSRRKAEYVLGLARAELDFDELALLPDGEVKARLTALRGLGEWSADWFLARHLGRPEAWPAGDLGLRKAVLSFYPDVTDVRAAGERFRPFQNLSAHYLLAALRYQ